MKTLKIILIIVAALLLVGLIFYTYYGGFKKVLVRIEQQGGEILVYEKMLGSYNNSGQVMDRIYHSLLDNEQLPSTKGFGLYFDNPQEVEESKLRSEIGCMLENLAPEKFMELAEKYNITIAPKQLYVVAEFPNKGKMSILFGIMKVYPAIAKYVKQNGYEEKMPIMEIYDVPAKKIIYRRALENHPQDMMSGW